MKVATRIFLAIMLVASVINPSSKVYADNVDGKKARQVGAYFMASQFGNKAITPSSLELVYEISNVEKDVATLYVFNTADKRGFVIVSGSDCIDPIIAYSTDGHFDPNNIPPAMQQWLGSQSNIIAYSQNNALKAEDATLETWKILEDQRLPYFGQDSKEIIRLLKTKWNQNYPYNALCPFATNAEYDCDGRAYVGCVATAMSQIIRYWEFPRVGQGVKGYHPTSNGVDTVLSVNFGNTYYRYEDMPAELTGDSSLAQIEAVALLGYHCGVSVEMGYDGDGSGTLSEYVPAALSDYFKYVADSMSYLSRDMVTYSNPDAANGNPNRRDTAWVNKIANDIMKGRPVYYAGHSKNGGRDAGHAFVCDGWNTSTKTLHFNWGWGGSGDCWCNVYTVQVKPTRSPEAGVTYHFVERNRAIIGITPPADSINNGNVAITGAENPFIGGIYPNPASTQVTVSYMLNDNSPAMMQIFDAAGRVVSEVKLSPVSTQVTIPVSNLRPGIYFCRLNGHTQKFVVR